LQKKPTASPPTTPTATVVAGECSCDAGEESTAQTFKCGNEIYVCPGVKRICSVQESQNSVYYCATQDQCDAMKLVEIGQKCVTLDHHTGVGNNQEKGLSNRVCYDGTTGSNGFNGMKEDGSCGVCNDSIDRDSIDIRDCDDVDQTPILNDIETASPTTTPTKSPTSYPTTAPTEAPTGSPTSPPTEAPTKAPTTDPITQVAEDKTYPPTQVAEELLPPNTCPEDIMLVKQTGVTEFPNDNAGVQIISQDTATVTVALNQYWTTAEQDPNTLDFIYYQYKDSLWAPTCYEEDNVGGGGATYNTITITCNLLSPVAFLEICVADDVVNGVLSAQDTANIPKCCHSTVPLDTPVVCYSFQISCESECVDPDAIAQRKLRGSSKY